MEDGTQSPTLHLDLSNFQDCAGSRYVLTSPRSLEACARLGVRPVDLLHTSHGEVREENPGATSQEVSDLYEAQEMERIKKVRLCRELRKNLLEGEPGRYQSTSANCPPPAATSSNRWDHQETSNKGHGGERETLRTRWRQGHATTSSSNRWDHQVTTSKGHRGERETLRTRWRQGHATTSSNRWDHQVTTSKGRREEEETLKKSWSQGHPSTSNRWDHQVTTSKGHRGEGETLRRSLSQVDLLTPEVEINRLAGKLEKEIWLSMPERDKKIATLMLLKHQEEEMSKQKMLQAEQAWEELKSEEKAIRAALSKKDWMDRQQNCRRNPGSSKLERQLGAIRYMTAQNDKQWKTLSLEQKMLLKNGLKKARHDLERKRRFQEMSDENTREMSSHLLKERMMQAFKAKMIKDLQHKKNIQVKNEYEKLRHSRLKEEVDSHVKAEEHFKRKSIQQKEYRSRKLYEQLLEERNKELQEKATREEELTLMAKIRAEKQEKEQRKQKEMQVKLTDQKMQQAKDSLGKSIQGKAERTRELNFIKEKAHHSLKQKIQEEEEDHRKEIEHHIRIKDQKSDKLLKEKEATIELGRKIARASFHFRDKIREQTKSRTFDQMVLEAQINASLLKPVP